ncbi:ATP-dependent DNA helicase PIF1 [Linum perenne]
MILRNLNTSLGLCNGTRVLITKLGHHVLQGIVIGGFFEGTMVAIPRIVLEITEHRWPFTLRRRQFPVRTCYSMTINKSQGQTMDCVGIYLPKPVFSHGQLYVAVLRVRSANGLHILIGDYTF